MSLTPQQLTHYETFGFIIQRGLLSSAEISALTDEFERKLDAVYSHMPYDDSMRHWSGLCLGDDTPMLLGLTEDPRFVGAAKQMYGDDVLLAGVDGNRYTSGFTKPADGTRDAGLTPWHPDHGTDENQDCYGVKMALYLEPTDADSGALRLVSVQFAFASLAAGIGRMCSHDATFMYGALPMTLSLVAGSWVAPRATSFPVERYACARAHHRLVAKLRVRIGAFSLAKLVPLSATFVSRNGQNLRISRRSPVTY
jgi:hypothetical protein